MVILIYPMFSNKTNLNADSNYVFIQSLIKGILKKRPDWQFLYIFPKNPDWTWKNDGFFLNPNIVRIPLNIPSAKKKMVVNFDADWWYDLGYRYAFDCILNNTPEITSNILSIQQTFTKDGIFKLVNQHHYIIHSDLPYPAVELGDKGIAYLQLIGTALADENMFNSLNCKKMIDDNYKKYFGSIPNYSYKINYFGFDFDYYDKYKMPKKKELTFIYNHRLQDYKNWRDTFEVFDYLYQKKYKFKVIVTSISAKNTEVSRKPYVDVVSGLYEHKDYLRVISQGHINVTNSQHETFCISAVESMIYGQVLVAPNKATFPELTSENYPYIFKTKEEQIKKIEYLITHPDEIEKYGKICQEFVRNKFNEERYIDNYIKVFEEQKFNINDTINGLKKRNDLEKFLDGIRGEIPLDILFRRLRQWIGQRQAFTNVRLKRILNYYGFKDKFKNGVQYFVK